MGKLLHKAFSELTLDMFMPESKVKETKNKVLESLTTRERRLQEHLRSLTDAFTSLFCLGFATEVK